MRSWAEPQRLEIKTEDAGETWQVTIRPRVVQVDERVKDECKGLLQSNGYRFVRLEVWSLTEKWARPFPVWLLLRAAYLSEMAKWRVLLWMKGHGFIHKAGHPGFEFRWRDLRLGPERAA